MGESQPPQVEPSCRRTWTRVAFSDGSGVVKEMADSGGDVQRTSDDVRNVIGASVDEPKTQYEDVTLGMDEPERRSSTAPRDGECVGETRRTRGVSATNTRKAGEAAVNVYPSLVLTEDRRRCGASERARTGARSHASPKKAAKKAATKAAKKAASTTRTPMARRSVGRAWEHAPSGGVSITLLPTGTAGDFFTLTVDGDAA